MSHGILGARAAIEDPEATLKRIADWAQEHAAEVLAADARAVFGRDHLESAVVHAERARAAGTMTARSIRMETLLYLSGRRQVVEALRVAGLRRGTRIVALVLWPPDAGSEDLLGALGWKRDDVVLDHGGKSLEVIGITKTEVGTVSEAAYDLALERVALRDLTK